MNHIVTATKDAMKPPGRRIVRELETHGKIDRINYHEYTISGFDNGYDTDRYFGELADRLNDFYGTNYKWV
ncbi:hypothetical protein FACS189421_11420 [Bacteroidia bacterium]|nr:hypothetical protein FACS189421_11420 [Bacteroidia bacterium]